MASLSTLFDGKSPPLLTLRLKTDEQMQRVVDKIPCFIRNDVDVISDVIIDCYIFLEMEHKQNLRLILDVGKDMPIPQNGYMVLYR